MSGDKPSFPERQEERLRDSRSVPGALARLAHFYAVCGAVEPLRALAPEIAQAGGYDAFAHALLTMDGSPEKRAKLIKGLAQHATHWAAYTLAKACLRYGEIEAAISVARTRLDRDPHDTAPLNLSARYAASRGEAGLARQLAEASLKVNPEQEDVVALMEAEAVSPPCLDVHPPALALSYYVPVFNAEPYLRTTLDALLALGHPLQEVIVVNDASTDASLEIAREYPVRIIEHPQNRGLGAARNTAFREARTPLVGAVDADAALDPDHAMHVLMEFENADPRLVGVGGPLRETDSSHPADRWRAQALAQDHGARRGVHMDLFGCNTVLRRDAVLEAGGYDESCRTNSEDMVLSQRLKERGHVLAYTPYAVAHHYKRDSLESVLRASWNWCLRGRLDAGVYTSADSAVDYLVWFMDREFGRLPGHATHGDASTLYVAFVNVVAYLVQDFGYAAGAGLLDDATRASLEQGLLQSLATLDARHGGELQRRVDDLVRSVGPIGPRGQIGPIGLMDDAPTGPLLREPWRVVLSAFAGHVETIDARLYRALCAAPSS